MSNDETTITHAHPATGPGARIVFGGGARVTAVMCGFSIRATVATHGHDTERRIVWVEPGGYKTGHPVPVPEDTVHYGWGATPPEGMAPPSAGLGGEGPCRG